MIPEMRDLSYESRLLQCGLITLEKVYVGHEKVLFLTEGDKLMEQTAK